MHAGTIRFNGADLSLVGKPTLTIRREADPPVFPTRQLVSLTVRLALEALDPGTVQARLRHLQATMQVGEGILASETGSGHGISWMATPTGDNLEAALSGRTNSVELQFRAVENHPGAAVQAIPSATFTPAGSSTPIQLHAIREPKEDIRTERHSERASARRATIVTRSFTARVAQANAADPAAERLSYLQEQAALIRAVDARQGVLTYGGETRIVRVQQLAPVIDESRNALDVQIQCYHVVFPDATKAESSYDIRTRRDEGTGEDVISVSGVIEAETREIAMGKLAQIQTSQATGNRRLTGMESSDRNLDGKDTEGVEGASWSGSLSFSMELRSPASGAHYTLRISSAKDIRAGRRWNYSGSVRAADEATALTLARSLGGAAEHPVQTRSEEVLEHVSDLLTPGTRRLVKLDFSYDYEGPGEGFIGGEISVDLNRPLFGEWRRTVSGFLVAETKASAETRLAALLSAEGTALEVTRRWAETYHDASGGDATPARVFQKLEFSAASRENRPTASAKFSDSTETDSSTLTQTRSVSGSLWTDSEANAESAFAELVAALFGSTPPQKISKTHQKERHGSTANSTNGGTGWAQLDFSMQREDKMAGTPGFDILEASYSLERSGSIQQVIITPIPFGRPIAQTNTGFLPGTLVLNARCKARLSATARTWVQAKRSLVGAIGTAGVTRHETAAPRETAEPSLAPFSGTEVTTWTFSGSYQWTFTGRVLDDLWPSGQGGVS